MVEGEGVEGADDDEGDDEAQDRLVEGVPVHVLRPVQVHHAHLHMLSAHNLGVQHDGDREDEAAQPHQHVDDDGPLDGPPLCGGVNNSYVPEKKRGLFVRALLKMKELQVIFIHDEFRDSSQARKMRKSSKISQIHSI